MRCACVGWSCEVQSRRDAGTSRRDPDGTGGDLTIAGLSLLGALTLVGDRAWPQSGSGRVWSVLIVVGAGYTLYSEWLNVSVRQSWAYSPLMPTLPPLGTGLSPLVQWLVVPTLALAMATGRPPWRSASPTLLR